MFVFFLGHIEFMLKISSEMRSGKYREGSDFDLTCIFLEGMILTTFFFPKDNWCVGQDSKQTSFTFKRTAFSTR
jgi:hypothetical protein